jgi:hypothetical protein
VVALVTAVLIGVALVLLVIPMSRRRPPGTPLTWGEAMVAALWAFFLMFWGYAMIPHLWLTWASNELGWRPDKMFTGWAGFLKPQKNGGWNPLTISYETIRDIIVVGIYVVFLGFQMWLTAWWQNRAKRAAEVPAITTSDYGRPLVRKS